MKPVAVAALLLLLAPPAGAADLLGKERVELTPFFGYRVGGQFASIVGDRGYGIDGSRAFGGLVDVSLQKDNYKIEFLWSRQQTRVEGRLLGGAELLRLDVDHIQAGIMQEVGAPRARFSVSLLLGASRFASPALGSEVHFSGSLTGSGKFFASPNLGLRLDARAHAVFVQGGSAVFCGGGCVLAYSGTALWQGEFTAGLILAF